MKYVFHPQARIELNNIIDYYEALQARLGLEFLEEVYSTVCQLNSQKHGLRFPKVQENVYSTDSHLLLSTEFGKMRF